MLKKEMLFVTTLFSTTGFAQNSNVLLKCQTVLKDTTYKFILEENQPSELRPRYLAHLIKETAAAGGEIAHYFIKAGINFDAGNSPKEGTGRLMIYSIYRDSTLFSAAFKSDAAPSLDLNFEPFSAKNLHLDDCQTVAL